MLKTLYESVDCVADLVDAVQPHAGELAATSGVSVAWGAVDSVIKNFCLCPANVQIGTGGSEQSQCWGFHGNAQMGQTGIHSDQEFGTLNDGCTLIQTSPTDKVDQVRGVQSDGLSRLAVRRSTQHHYLQSQVTRQTR